MSVKSWPKYLLRDIPDHLRSAIEEDADLDGTSMIEVVRGILCAHYKLDCSPVDSVQRSEFIPGTGTMVLRLQPELFEKLNADVQKAASPYGAKKKVVMDILADHYNGGHPR